MVLALYAEFHIIIINCNQYILAINANGYILPTLALLRSYPPPLVKYPGISPPPPLSNILVYHPSQGLTPLLNYGNDVSDPIHNSYSFFSTPHNLSLKSSWNLLL